ncbi:MAG: hypothetical protein LBP53_01110 [Candidatus Peribacteria bacterium]|nr:hypothetical protein [Candidatus Peribacteria bacterium]
MTVNTPNVPKELKDMNIAELQQSFNDAVKQGDMQKAKVVMDEWNKKAETNNETLITENTDLKDVYKKLATFNNDENAEWQNEWGSDEEKKKRRQEFRKFILEDIQTYKSNLEKQHKNITDEKEKQINDLMNLLGAKDNEITSLTEKNKHLQERVLKLPNWKEIIPGAPGRRFNKLATQLKALVSTS